MTGINPEDTIRGRQEAILNAVTLRDLPKLEVFEMQGGISVLSSERRYANFFKEVCLEQQDLLEELAHEEENFFMLRRDTRKTKKKYLVMADQLCFNLKKRLERPDTDSDDDFHHSDGSYQIQRT